MSSIFVAEDSLTQQAELQYILEDAGFHVQMFPSGQDCWEYLQQAEALPDLIISDVMMPGMSGYEFCQKVKSHSLTKHIPVMLLTSMSSLEDVLKGLLSQADSFVTKPYDPQVLLTNVQRLLEHPEWQREPLQTLTIPWKDKVYSANVRISQMLGLLLSSYESAIWNGQRIQEVNRELLKSKQDLEKKNQQLEELSRFKSTLLGIVAHDLRNPLSVILGYTRFLEVSPHLGSQEKRFIQAIYKNIDYILHLLEDLLDFSQLETGELVLKRIPIDFNSLIEEVLDLERPLAEQKDISIVFDNWPDSILVSLDVHRFRQVISNLLSNAVKFSHPGTTIWVRTELQDEGVLLSIQDEGQGIAEEELPLLFRPFSTTSTKATSGEKSTGLGLAITKRIVESHGGKIWVKSQVGQGSTFYVWFPMEQAQEKEADKKA